MSATQTAPTISAGSATVLGQTMKIEGSISSAGDLVLNGEVQGTIESQGRVTIGAGATVKATVKAKEVVVAGSVTGNVDAKDRVLLCSGSNLVGDLKTAGIVIEDGAFFKGGIDIARPPAAA